MKIDDGDLRGETPVAMPVVFRDNSHNRGRITDGLSVEYDGPVAVEAYVQEIEVETNSTERAIE